MLLCVALVAALSVSAFAADPAPKPDAAPIPGSMTPQGSATVDRNLATAATQLADQAAEYATAAGEVKKSVEAYEKVKNSTSSTQADLCEAYDKLQNELNVIWVDHAADIGTYAPNGITFADLTTASNYTGLKAAVTVGAITVPVQTNSGLVPNTSRHVGSLIPVANRFEAAQTVLAAQYVLAVDYDMSAQGPMDWNQYIINATAKEQAQQTKDAAAAAAAAKSGALSAQATAKVLINKAMTVAQDAAKEAVASAQATAYNNLAAAYATAVADFWADVSAEIATW